MHQKKTVTVTVALWAVLSLFYYNIFNLLEYNPIKKYLNPPYSRKYIYNWSSLPQYNGTEDYLINTPGCYIPNYSKTIFFNEASYKKKSCYDRIVYVNKTLDHNIQFYIDQKKLKKNAGNFTCCYKFAMRSSTRGQEDFQLSYSECKPFNNGSIVEQKEEVIIVSCTNHATLFTYQDAYLILMKKFTDPLEQRVKHNIVDMTNKWNVLLVGLDTMSRSRAYNSLPKTVRYLRKHQWLDFRGYQKVAHNTFPNIMSLLTGKNSSTVYKECAKDMAGCRDNLIWNRFKDAGYMTAFGEDNLKLPDTFSPYKGFVAPPTDHYARPLFLTGEYLMGNYLCTKSEPSGVRILDYAKQFAESYRNDSFFGLFWINSFSHNMDYLPRLYEKNLIEFFEHLSNNGVLYNTFVIFFSDHGVRYGHMRVSTESHYEERLPMLFMWVPHGFREVYPLEYYNLQMNQQRLVTPYDLHATLWKIMKLSKSYVDIVPPAACPNIKGLTEEISLYRTCSDACVEEKWCTCHDMSPAKNDSAAQRSLKVAVANVQSKALSVKTTHCSICSPLKLKKVLRNDWYIRGNKTYYVIAFMLSPSDLAFEATVEHYQDEFNVLPPTDTIVPYNKRGYCVANTAVRAYCVCVPIKNCKKKG